MPRTKTRKSASAHPQNFSFNYRPMLAPCLLALATLVVYSNTFDVPFLFDDRPRILENSNIRTLWPLFVPMTDSTRPLGMLTFAVNYAMHGLNVWGYHAANLAIHILAGLTLFGIIRRTLSRGELGRRYGDSATLLAFAVALLWLIHPLNTQAVTYIVQRLESLMGLCYLLTLYFFIRAQDSPRKVVWLLASVVCCALGMGVKEVMVTAPVMVLWYHRAFVAKSWSSLLYGWSRYYYPTLFATWGILVWTMLRSRTQYEIGAIGTVQGVTPIDYLLTQGGVITHYLRLSVWPYGQCLDYAWPIAQTAGQILPPLFFIGFLFMVTVWAICRHPNWGFLGGWFFLILGPTSSFVPIVDFAFEQRMYLPLLSVIALFIFALHRFGAYLKQYSITARKRQPWIVTGTVLLLVLQMSFLSWGRNEVYRSEVSIWADTVAKSPRNPRAHCNFAAVLIDIGEPTLAEGHCRRALLLESDYGDAHNNLVIALLKQGKFDAAVAQFQVAIQFSGSVPHAIYDFGNALLDAGKPGLAIEQFRRAIQIDPDFIEAHTNLAAAMIEIGEFQSAVKQCDMAIRINSEFAAAYLNRSLANYRLERYGAAWLDLEKARARGLMPSPAFINALKEASEK